MALIKNYNVDTSINLPDAPTADNQIHITSSSPTHSCRMQSSFTKVNAYLQAGSSNVVHFCGLHSDGSYSDDTVQVSGGQTYESNLTNPDTLVAGYFYMVGTLGTNLHAWLS